jgi:tetratricopeptide (TPR) repeat protein
MKSAGAALAVVALMAGVAMLAYARWTSDLNRADQALAAGRLDEALTGYKSATLRFDRVPAARQMFATDYDHAVANHLWVLYRLKRYDETIEVAERAPASTLPHFWSGCAFFEKAVVEEKPETRLGWLSRAEEEFRKAVEAAPDDWDTKYDFELTSRLAAELRRQPKTPPRQLMQLLRPPSPTGKPARSVG